MLSLCVLPSCDLFYALLDDIDPMSAPIPHNPPDVSAGAFLDRTVL